MEDRAFCVSEAGGVGELDVVVVCLGGGPEFTGGVGADEAVGEVGDGVADFLGDGC
jgi:hypothetical protein